MAATKISAKTGKSDPVEINFDFGNTDEDMVKKFTLKIVCSYARANMKVGIQDVIRTGILADKTAGSIQKEVDAYKFGVKKRGKNKAEKLADSFAALSDEEKASLLARLSK